MTLQACLCPAILQARLDQIAPLFLQGAKGDMQAARDAVMALLADYDPQTDQELTLAADIVHYRMLAVDNLRRSAEPDLALTKVLRLRGSAVSLSREAHKAQRQLDKLRTKPAATGQAARSAPDPAAPTPAELAALHAARDILKGKKPNKFDHVRHHDKRAMAETIKANAARFAAAHAA